MFGLCFGYCVGWVGYCVCLGLCLIGFVCLLVEWFSCWRFLGFDGLTAVSLLWFLVLLVRWLIVLNSCIGCVYVIICVILIWFASFLWLITIAWLVFSGWMSYGFWDLLLLFGF